MSKLKNKVTSLKISAAADKKPLEKPHFSFEYLTSNNNFNFEWFTSKAKRDKTEAKAALIDRLIEISSSSWLFWNSLDKKHGIETISIRELNFSPSGYKFSSDEKVTVFRFFNQKYRIIGFKDTSLPTYYIIGFDFDYSAYNHGS